MNKALEGVMCECCNLNPAVAVASTCIPYSAAYCAECAHNACNPLWIGFAQMDLIGGVEACAQWFLEGETIFDPLNRRYVTMGEYFRYYIPVMPDYEKELEVKG